MEENKKSEIKAYRFDMTVPKFKLDNGKQVPVGVKTDTCYFATGYADDEIDYGEYWDVSDGSFYLSDKDGNYILGDFCQIEEWNEICDTEGDIRDLVKTLENPHDWFEIRYGQKKDCKLRVTALPERPRICAEKCATGDVSLRGLHRIKIYGQPVAKDGILTSTNRLWIDDLKERILDSIREKAVKENGVEIAWNGDGIVTNGNTKEIAFNLTVVAPDVGALKRVIVNLGANEVNEMQLKTKLAKGNDLTGDSHVFADIVVSNMD